jgi:hypothetical protein
VYLVRKTLVIADSKRKTMCEQKYQTEKSGVLQCYATAGELFGHLRESLGFGELVMLTRTWGQSAQPRVVAYQWAFKVGGERYCCEEAVALLELEHMQSIQVFAKHLSDKWKHQHKTQTKEPSA